MTDMRERAAAYVRELQDRICKALEDLDGGARFREDRWEREGGGGGISRVLEKGSLFEKAGVNTSVVYGEVPETLSGQLKGSGGEFYATGVSLVLHPRNPHVPTVHANFRFMTRGEGAWFGGGADLTPYFPHKSDVRHFHGTLKAACDAHDPAFYPRFKKWCDDYFYLPHREEMRGVGGIFFDELPADEAHFDFLRSAGDAFLPAYLPIAERRMGTPWNDRERAWQLIRRGRYVEFNLVYDRGTIFGLRSQGRTESILMSLPPQASWAYDHHPLPGSPEEQALAFYQPGNAWA
ncbi:oxygen-dependent coproporphyrinogen oxidase [Vulgatibacter sp.]|uniref:oxygen-dependent coproporphyrinogen oxidase n=1 Tax=Vulgatibacter sp. TaxID=1971226 RepID=UPI003566CCE1